MKYSIQANDIIRYHSTERENNTMMKEASQTALYMAEMLSSGTFTKGHI